MSARFRWTLTKQASQLYPQTSEVLTNDPIGWDEMTLRLSRDALYHGVFTEFTLSLRWHCEGGGKEYIDNIYNLEDINANITVLIEIDCDSSGTYVELYTGKLNLASYSTDGQYTTCNIEKSDLFSKLKAREEINVDLETTESIGDVDIAGVGIKTLPMHSMLIRYDNEWRIKYGYEFETDLSFDTGNEEANGAFISHAAPIVSSDIENFASPGIEQVEVTTAGSTNWEDRFIQPLVTFDDDGINYPIQVNWEIDWNGIFTDTYIDGVARENNLFGLILYWGVKDPDVLGSVQSVILLDESGYSSSPTKTVFFNVASSGTMTIRKGDSIWLSWVILENYNIPGQTVRLKWVFDESYFKFNTETEYERTTAKSILIHEAFNIVSDAIADKDYAFYSDFYGRTDSRKISYAANGCGSKIAISNGFNIREFQNKKILCSLKELFQSADALHNIGLTIEQVDSIYAGSFEAIRVEPITYFYDNTTQILNLTNPIKVEKINDNTRYFNDIIIGYDRWESEFKGGLDEPCAKHNYSTRINPIKGQYSKLSKYIASSYAIERTRRKNRFPTEDWRFDNDNFFVSVKNDFEGELIFFHDVIDTIQIFDLEVSNFTVGDVLVISGTVSNNGTFTVATVNSYYAGGVVLVVNEVVVNETASLANLTNQSDGIYSPEKYTDFLTLVLPTGMISAFTAYNLRLTPSRMLQPHMKSISAGLTKIGGQAKFINGEGNVELQTQFAVGGCPESYAGVSPDRLLENQSISWNDAWVIDGTPLWIPETYKFEYPLSASQLSAIRETPHGYIQGIDDHGNTFKGFILDVEYKLKTGLTKFELLKLYEA